MRNFFNKIFTEWSFINYCFQRIGMWNRYDLVEGVNHAFKIQITNLLLPFFAIPYLYFNGPEGIFIFIFLGPFVFLIFHFCKKHLTENISNLNLDEKYLKTKRSIRVLNFILGLLLTILCIVYFIVSLMTIRYI